MAAAAKRVAVVVGGMRGNGWGAARHLLQQATMPTVVYATAHPLDIEKAPAHWLTKHPSATSSIDAEIAKKGCELVNMPLALENPEAIADFRKKLVDSHGPDCVSVLVNAVQRSRKVQLTGETGTDDIISVLRELYWGSRNLADQLLPLMPRDGNSRVVHIATPKSGPDWFKNEKLAARFRREGLTWAHLDEMMKEYADAIRTQHYEDTDWPPSEESKVRRNTYPFTISKVAVAAMVFPMSRDYPGVLINACRPEAWKAGEQFPTVFKLATGNVEGVTGGWWENEKQVAW